MEIDFKAELKHLWVYERPYKVTLTRGAKGDYRWEIEVRGVDPFSTLGAIGEVDNSLREKYGGLESTGEEG